MSKIGKINITIPDKVKVLLSGNTINIEGPLGKKSLNIDTDIFDLKINEGKDVSIITKKIILKVLMATSVIKLNLLEICFIEDFPAFNKNQSLTKSLS